MRTGRIRYDGDRCFYHVMNRVAGEPGFLPFGEVEKEYLFRLARSLSRFYTIDILSLVAMGNHYHCVCVTYPQLPSLSEMRQRFLAYYGRDRQEPNWADPSVREHLGTRMRDISMFVKDLQQGFTRWYNRTRPRGRRGRLWADRFKSVILDGEHSVWECIKYVEMNPVRAGLCADPAEYRFGTWGRMQASGAHPFGGAFEQHVREYLGECAAHWSGPRLVREFGADMARVAASERGEDSEGIFAAEARARGAVPAPLRLTRRVRYWSDGAIIGSRLFVMSLTAELFGAARARTKRFGVTASSAGTVLVSYRQLRCT